MIAVVFGTTGELIKLAPVLVRLQERGAPTTMLCTGQQVEQIPTLLEDFGLSQPDLWLGRGYRGRDLERAADLPAWFARVGRSFVSARRMVRDRVGSSQGEPLVVVHGDTFTTVIGALLGRALRVPVAHIEAGMRSGDWRNPFPEELDRVTVARLARIHFAPGPHAVANLRAMWGVRGEIVDTGQNTIRDALDLVPAGAPALELPEEPFGLVSLHRAELLGRSAAFRTIVELLHDASRRIPMLFVDHPVTAAAIESQRLDSLFDERLRRVPRQRYFRFISLLKASGFLVTDSGGSQQECAYLGHPCLIHRTVTEHPDGLDSGSVVLSGMESATVRAFLDDPFSYVREPTAEHKRPTDLIVEYMERGGHVPSLAPVGLSGDNR